MPNVITDDSENVAILKFTNKIMQVPQNLGRNRLLQLTSSIITTVTLFLESFVTRVLLPIWMDIVID